MRKAILILSLVTLSSYIVNAQTTVITDDSTYTPTSINAMFEVYSQNNDKGILIPRMTTVQRTAISTSGTVDQSLMVFDTDTKTFWYFDGANWVEMATGGTVSDDQNIDSLTLNGLTLTTYIEDGNSAFVDLTAVSDSAISYIINNSDTLFSNDYFTDSLASIIYNYGDTLFTNQTFIDSLTSAIYNYGDTLLYNSEFITALQDSIDTDIDNAYLTSNTLNIDENGNTVSVDLTPLVNDADADPTNEIELPATAINGQVLTWNGSDWVAQNAASGADNWGSQVVMSDATLSGDGTAGNELTVVGDLTDDQQLSFTSNIISLTDGGSVNLSGYLDNTDNQNLSFSGTSLSIDNGNTVNLGALVGTDDQNISGSGLSGTTLTIGIEGGANETVDLSSLVGTDDQNISGSGFNTSTNILTIGIENGTNETVDLSSLAGASTAWKLTGNAASTSNFIGTTNSNPLNFKVNNIAAGKLATDNTFFGYESGLNNSSGTGNIFIGQSTGKKMYSGNANVAMGYQALYNYGNTSTIGDGNVAIGKYAMFYYPVGGANNVAVGYNAYSLPHSSGGSENVFVGHASDAGNTSPSNVVALGAYSKVIANYATAIGYRAYANHDNSLILGQTTNDGNPNSATANTNVGINTISPDVNANITLGEMDGTNEGGQISFAGAGSYSGWVTDLYQDHYRIFSESSSVTTLQIFNNGSSVTDLAIDGQAYKPGGGSWAVSSDRRSKENIINYNKGLKELLQLRPVNFNYRKEFNWGSKTYTGLIAQEVEKVVPTMVETRPTNGIQDFKVIDPNELTYMLINAVKELKQKNDEQQKTIDKLIKQNQEILNQLKK